MSTLQVIATLGFGLIVGVVAALFGIGGGLLMAPFIVLVLGKDQHLAEGTSLLVMIPIAVAGAIEHRRKGFLDLYTAAIVGTGGVAGAVGGALAALALDAEQLTRMFGIVLVLVGARLVSQGLKGSGTPRIRD